MGSDRLVRREIAIEPDSEPIRGELRGGEEAPRNFLGWLELFAAVEDLRTAAATPDEATHERTHFKQARGDAHA